MTLADLIAAFRLEVQDTVGPDYLWTDAEIAEYANDAVMEAARRSLCISDNATAAICSLAYTTSGVVDYDTRIIQIKSAIVSGQTLPLTLATTQWMDDNYPGWESATAATPLVAVLDWALGQLKLYPTPTASGTLNLRTVREPLAAMDSDLDEPEIPARWHRPLLHWMKHRAYLKDDTETRDENLAQIYEGRFAAEFGERKSARNEAWAQQTTGQMADTLA